MKCGECLINNVKMVDLVNGVCPECGADYSKEPNINLNDRGPQQKHELYIVVSFGYYGKGKTEVEAIKAWRKAGGRKVRAQGKRITFRGTSELPFAPFDREATEQEADLYLTKDGRLFYKRCEVEQLGK